MWPVGTPQCAVGENFDDVFREWNNIIVSGRSGQGQPLRAADLGPHILVISQQPHELIECLTVDNLCDVRAGHVIEHHHTRQRREELGQIGKILRLDVDDQMPPEWLDAFSDFDQSIVR